MRIEPSLLDRLYREAEAERWRLAKQEFAAALERSLAKAPAAATDAGGAERYLRALHLRDLALACACEKGEDDAWDEFVRSFRPVLYRAADALDPHGGARDLADSLYGDLFGTTADDKGRRSLLRYFHGRSSLATWLRAVLAQRHVDRLRSGRRSEPLPGDETAAALPAEGKPPAPERSRYLQLMTRGLARAIAALDVRDRLRLACYYAQNLTLAQTGRVLSEHEATTSRQLARTRKAIRTEVERQLRTEQRMSDAELDQCFASVAEDAGTIDLTRLIADTAAERAGEQAESVAAAAGQARKGIGSQRSTEEST